jgi:hypothetical protein
LWDLLGDPASVYILCWIVETVLYGASTSRRLSICSAAYQFEICTGRRLSKKSAFLGKIRGHTLCCLGNPEETMLDLLFVGVTIAILLIGVVYVRLAERL